MNSIRHIQPLMNKRIEAYPSTALGSKYMLLFLYSGSLPWYLSGRFSDSSSASAVWRSELTRNPINPIASTARKHDHAAMRSGIL